ncbi:MAG: response regulator transcription factor [Candidatus Gygaella obscura]|nr:response regulator transcription factor [Candidatus Gygaella obscura]
MAKILIIEDEPDAARVVSKRLKNHGFDVAIAEDAYQGVKMAHEILPNLIILDLMLPAGGGLSVLKNIRLSSQLQSIPILVLTASKDEQHKKKIIDEGVDAFMEKPYDADELLTNIVRLLGDK